MLSPDIFDTGTITVTSTQGGEAEVVFAVPSEVNIFTTSTQDLAKWTLTQKLPLAKLLCHKIVDHISEQGMPELCESMADIYDFDLKRAQYQHQALPHRESVPAKLGKSYQRPSFQITEE